MELLNLINSLISGALGGNIAGAALKDQSLGTVGNSIAGILGGGVGGMLLQSLGESARRRTRPRTIDRQHCQRRGRRRYRYGHHRPDQERHGASIRSVGMDARISWFGVLMRLVGARAMVLLTYNPTGYSFSTGHCATWLTLPR